MNTKITDWLEAIKAGDMTVEDVAERFRNGALNDGEPVGSAQESLADSGRPYETGTFDEVSRGLHLGLIDIDQYGILAEAAAGQTKDRNAPEDKPAAKAPAKKAPPAPQQPPTAPPSASPDQ